MPSPTRASGFAQSAKSWAGRNQGSRDLSTNQLRLCQDSREFTPSELRARKDSRDLDQDSHEFTPKLRTSYEYLSAQFVDILTGPWLSVLDPLSVVVVFGCP
ncbi:hypothetical protein DPMN_104846 [Dreissena polymorpha]|uniref:Uncharacterized protein n=1 Tax=Dreissena polymorpha TaxID=45954 RepID=A0A9D4K1F6_DREPO|nr:hypothetical protein DPMN_104846 [Dreissena polymorpha]